MLKCEGRVVFLGMEQKTAKKDANKIYNIASFLDDKKSFDMFVFDDDIYQRLTAIRPMTDVNVVFDLRFNDRGPGLYIKDVTPVSGSASAPAPNTGTAKGK